MRIEALKRDIAEAKEALLRPGAGFAAQAKALDFLQEWALGRLNQLQKRSKRNPELQAMKAEVLSLCRRLEAANQKTLDGLKRQIRSGSLKPRELKKLFLRHAGRTGDPGAFDALDTIIDGLTMEGSPRKLRPQLEAGMVAYQPTPSRVALKMMEEAKITEKDVFYDIGSGLGRVVFLVGMLSGAGARGVEFEPGYSEFAQTAAKRLKLRKTEFIEGDARKVSLDEGTVFFFFTPFLGEMLAQVMEKLRVLATRKPIRICSYGPCTREIAKLPWLKARSGSFLKAFDAVIFRS